MQYRNNAIDSDVLAVKNLAAQSGFFSLEEIEVAAELVQANLSKGESVSGYSFIFLETKQGVLGYTCYGRIPGTETSYDLYWIIVTNSMRKRSLGQQIMAETEKAIQKAGGRRLYADTSSRELYIPTRAFYRKCGFEQEAVLKDFYSQGDDKVIFVKALDPLSSP